MRPSQRRGVDIDTVLQVGLVLLAVVLASLVWLLVLDISPIAGS